MVKTRRQAAPARAADHSAFFAPSLRRADHALARMEQLAGCSQAVGRRDADLIAQLQGATLNDASPTLDLRLGDWTGDDDDWPRLESNDEWCEHPGEPHAWRDRNGPVSVLWRVDRRAAGHGRELLDRGLASALRIQEKAICKSRALARKAAPPRGARSSFRRQLEEHYGRQEQLQSLRRLGLPLGRAAPSNQGRLDVIDQGLSLVRITPAGREQ